MSSLLQFFAVTAGLSLVHLYLDLRNGDGPRFLVHVAGSLIYIAFAVRQYRKDRAHAKD